MPILKVIVQIEVLLQDDLLVRFNDANDGIQCRLMWLKVMIEVPYVRGQRFHGGLTKDGIIISQIGRLSTVQVDLGVVGLGFACELGT